MTEAVRQPGWIPGAVARGTEAFEKVLSRTSFERAPDVIRLTRQMPDKSGLEVPRAIKAPLPEIRTPALIMVKATSRTALEQLPDSTLANDVLSKPIVTSEL